MRRFLKTLATIALVFMFTVPVAMAAAQDMWATVYANDRDGAELREITSGVTFVVLARSADTAETLTYYGGTTSLTNPVTTTSFASDTICNDRVAFRVDPTDGTYDRYVDLIVVDTDGGYTAFIEDFDKYQHIIVIDERPNIEHHGCIWLAASTAETNTGIDFLYDTVIHDVRVEVVTIDATETIDVGLLSSETNGDADGLLDGVAVGVAGFIADTADVTLGTNADYWSASTYGALLITSTAGADTSAATLGEFVWQRGHYVTGANAVSLTHTGSAGSDTFAGYLHYFFTRLR